MVTSRQLTVSSTRRDAWVEVDLGAIEHNVQLVLSWLGGEGGAKRQPRLMAVVKSDAYGHGAVDVAEVLIGAGAQWLAVASVDEGCQLRAVDAKIPILILSPVPSWAVQAALDHDLDFTVTSTAHVAEIVAVAKRRPGRARVHLKIDTGMHRLGTAAPDVDEVFAEIRKSDRLRLVSVFSHLAKADEHEAVALQNAAFENMVRKIRLLEPGLISSGHVDKKEGLLFHLASGDAARRFPETHYDMVRAGLILYGLEALEASKLVSPAMSVRARINHLSEIEAGESVGYGWTWTAKRRTRLASIPIGYADGVDRRLSNRLTALLLGKPIAQVGRISMDQMLFDITDVPEAQETDVITLIGADGEQKIELATWATMLDTITYELACRMRVRLPRIYTRHRVPASKGQ